MDDEIQLFFDCHNKIVQSFIRDLIIILIKKYEWLFKRYYCRSNLKENLDIIFRIVCKGTVTIITITILNQITKKWRKVPKYQCLTFSFDEQVYKK